MLTYEQAKKKGIDACVDCLGRDFVMKYKDTSCPTFGDMEDRAYCFLGVNNSEDRYDDRPIILDGGDSWPYSAECTVRYDDGKVEFLECIVPK